MQKVRSEESNGKSLFKNKSDRMGKNADVQQNFIKSKSLLLNWLSDTHTSSCNTPNVIRAIQILIPHRAAQDT